MNECVYHLYGRSMESNAIFLDDAYYYFTQDQDSVVGNNNTKDVRVRYDIPVYESVASGRLSRN